MNTKAPTSTPTPAAPLANMPLRTSVRNALRDYLDNVDSELVTDLYALVLSEVEAPMLQVVMEKVRFNQSKAGKLLGLNRGTLRTKLKQYDLLD
jgi:Fis family transcriptional regulator